MYDFIVLGSKKRNMERKPNCVYLTSISWNDFSFHTLFYMEVVDSEGIAHKVGQVKIGFLGQTYDIKTFDKIPKKFTFIGDEFFSLAESPDFYKNLYQLGEDKCNAILEKTNNVVISNNVLKKASGEEVFKTSLLRDVNINTVKGQFTRLIKGEDLLSEFDFSFLRQKHKFSDINIRFSVDPFSYPPSNIHALIGRNGLGKTTLLNEMVSSIVKKNNCLTAYFEDEYGDRINSNFFSTVISISFSAFDPFNPVSEQSDPQQGTCHYYIGLKKNHLGENPKLEDMQVLHRRCAESIEVCFSDEVRKSLWIESIKNLESDKNFLDLDLTSLAKLSGVKLLNKSLGLMEKMSSGHAIIFMTLSRLVEKVQDKTLVLFDEPESHLHPPLLSAFIRSLSNLLYSRNGVAIIATHSPVVVQEIPKNCRWVLTRFGDIMKYARPKIETFAENVGTLTKEVFRLELEQSGFHKLLKEKVDEGLSFNQIMDTFRKRIGFEGQAIVRSMIMLRDTEL
ncbi:ATP-binding protein [Erwinia mallotivora]|uniref:ATP-binding protein n=1 Tax=Erwinia mallotivora TaxID=69222 RepID=UPI0021BF0ADD|nr:ATP-binding protein [Erwinia mallotivora]